MARQSEALSARTRELEDRREPHVLATVVRAQHPSSAHPGDTAVILADGSIEGFVGGNCVEASVRDNGLRVLAGGEPLLLRVLPGPLPDDPGEGAVNVANPCLSGGAVEIFLQPRLPAPRVLLVGTSPTAQALQAMAEVLGFETELAEGTALSPTAADAAVIVASHGAAEEPALEAALRAGVRYIALVASGRRGSDVLASLDVSDADRARVHCPAGLALGARTPAETALSILAELVAERRLRSPAPSLQPAAAPATAVDPVCGMSVAAVDASLHAEHAGTTVYFCSPGCRKAFLAAPERYAKAS
ncbi:XdhC family protein [Arthrobacter sp. USHLN218]|uniref:XdhC family protein n=1 Tax=Arthrobacter sp. USHLN218 TaxID=3081232 RepID=UPI00301B50B1